jgi:tryptophan-rich sensory protein
MSTATEIRKTFEEQLTHSIGKSSIRWRWYHGVTFYVLAQVVSFGLAGLVSVARGEKRDRQGEQPYYRSQKQIKIAPPGWVFGPAWTINNISTIYGNLRALNLPKETHGRTILLGLQAASWVTYGLFSASYFSLRSPLNAAVITLLMFGLTIASLLVSIFQLKDTKIAFSLATLFLWLTLASVLATTQALWNRDEFYEVGPFVEPKASFLKDWRS